LNNLFRSSTPVTAPRGQDGAGSGSDAARSLNSVKTYTAKPEDIQRRWYIVDAEGKTLGRMATVIANILRGKNKPIFTPHMDCGDYIVVINADKVAVTGNRMDEKMYYHHSGYPGGLTTESMRTVMGKNPDRVIRQAVQKMLPKNTLSKQVLKKLKIYSGTEHPHGAQQPEVLVIE
jgi:large subunit ribosomal protein L13